MVYQVSYIYGLPKVSHIYGLPSGSLFSGKIGNRSSPTLKVKTIYTGLLGKPYRYIDIYAGLGFIYISMNPKPAYPG